MSFGDDTLGPSNFWDGKERRSGGPMAATVDRVIADGRSLSRGQLYQQRIKLVANCYPEFLSATIRRAAENAALSIADMIDCRHDSPYVADFVTAIERHVRLEMGL